MVKILGENFKRIRKSKGFTQADLAHGICTQATVSLVERRNQVPSTKILMQLCQRLEVSVDKIIVQEEDQLHVLMRKLQDLANDDEFEQAHHIIQQIHSNELAEPEDFKRYYYYQGQISLLLQDSPDDALFFFHRAYEQYVTSRTDTYGVLCIIGMSLANVKKGQLDRAQKQVDKAIRIMDSEPGLMMIDFPNHLRIYGTIAEIFCALGAYPTARRYVKEAIQDALDKHSLYLLDYLYFVLGQIEVQRENDQKALQHFHVAQTLAQIRKHPLILTQANAQIQKLA